MSNQATEERDDRKAGPLPPWMTGSARVGSGGFGSGGAAAADSSLMKLFSVLLGPKAIVAATVLGGMAVGLGIVRTIQPPAGPSLAQQFNKERLATGSPSGTLPGMEQPGQSALNMAQQANSGFYSASAAPAQGQAQADQSTPDPSVDAPADAAAAPGAGKDAAAAQGQDPAQLAAALLKGQKTKAGLPHNFGQLSSGLGGGLALNGGAGLAGGIGGSFQRPNLTNSEAGRLGALRGGAAVRQTRVPLAAHNLGKSAFKGANAKRLDNMNRAMGTVRNAEVTQAADVHTQQWDGAQPVGTGLTGAGLSGISGGGQFSGNEGVGNGGPLDNGSQNGATSVQQPSNINNGTNQTPYQGQLVMAQGMLVLASAIITVIGALAMMGHIPIVGTWAAALQTLLFGVATGLAAASTAIGMNIASQYGQGMQGGMIATGGAITTAFSIAAMIAPCSIPAWTAVVAGIAGMAASVAGGAGSSGKLGSHPNISNG